MAALISSYESDTVQCSAPGCERGMRVKGLCSKHYLRLRTYGAVNPLPRDCRQCGESFSPQSNGRSFCSKQCMWQFNDRRRGVRPIDIVNAERREAATRQCKECGARFLKDNGSNLGHYCSRHCSQEPRRRYGAAARSLRKWGLRERSRLRAMEELASCVAEMRLRLCQCGNVLQKCQRLCPTCADTRRRHRQRNDPSRRADKAYRKALERGKVDGAEKFDPLEILSRDGWRCHICGISTPKRLRGTYHDQAPELDHIVPLSLGGRHTRINTACACRKCNGAKGATIKGQLRLAA
jgi:5-methylcytosine-specific restriction endonuclease McrA/endogenous inhibitor of DNA gyrase (YacG/DUF329 family)